MLDEIFGKDFDLGEFLGEDFKLFMSILVFLVLPFYAFFACLRWGEDALYYKP